VFVCKGWEGSSEQIISFWVAYQYSFRFHVCQMSLRLYPLWLYHSDYIWRGLWAVNLLIMQLSPTRCHLTQLLSKHCPQYQISTPLLLPNNNFLHSYMTELKVRKCTQFLWAVLRLPNVFKTLMEFCYLVCSSLIFFRSLCGPHQTKGKQAISCSQNFLSSS
jgi:hypothetical protein